MIVSSWTLWQPLAQNQYDDVTPSATATKPKPTSTRAPAQIMRRGRRAGSLKPASRETAPALLVRRARAARPASDGSALGSGGAALGGLGIGLLLLGHGLGLELRLPALVSRGLADGVRRPPLRPRLRRRRPRRRGPRRRRRSLRRPRGPAGSASRGLGGGEARGPAATPRTTGRAQVRPMRATRLRARAASAAETADRRAAASPAGAAASSAGGSAARRDDVRGGSAMLGASDSGWIALVGVHLGARQREAHPHENGPEPRVLAWTARLGLISFRHLPQSPRRPQRGVVRTGMFTGLHTSTVPAEDAQPDPQVPAHRLPHARTSD